LLGAVLHLVDHAVCYLLRSRRRVLSFVRAGHTKHSIPDIPDE
jgi:hypothetical protein